MPYGTGLITLQEKCAQRIAQRLGPGIAALLQVSVVQPGGGVQGEHLGARQPGDEVGRVARVQ